jgi:hypothetical protein
MSRDQTSWTQTLVFRVSFLGQGGPSGAAEQGTHSAGKPRRGVRAGARSPAVARGKNEPSDHPPDGPPDGSIPILYAGSWYGRTGASRRETVP